MKFRIALYCIAALVALGSGTGAFCIESWREVISSDEGDPGAGTLNKGVAGRITTVESYPVAGAFVQVSSSGGPGPVPDIAILSDKDGYYNWALMPGTYELSVSADGYKPVTRRVAVEAGNVATLDFILESIPTRSCLR
jgi:hypothetical protein